MNPVEVTASKRVLASVTESGDYAREPSATMLSKQATMEERRFLIRPKASIHSIHHVLQNCLRSQLPHE